MKALFLPLLLFSVCGGADEAADHTAITRAIAALNEFPQPAGLFTADADGPAVIDQLWKGRRLAYRMRPASSSDQPTVIISHEPWGEATINFPTVPVEIVNPPVVGRTIRFVTPNVALVDGAFTVDADSVNPQTTPLLFVMKKERQDWKIASIRVLAAH
ncbi:MAG: hypothetical protein ABSC23_04120 [Bryobacteraceae bacterium]|jgi:hypothetical protein